MNKLNIIASKAPLDPVKYKSISIRIDKANEKKRIKQVLKIVKP